MSHPVFNATVRDAFGGKASVQYRDQGLVPVSISRSGAESVHLLVSAKDAEALVRRVSQVAVLDVAGQKHQTVVKGFDRHPINDQVLSLDLLAVNDDQVVTVEVRVTSNPNADCPGLRAGGLLEQMMRRVVVAVRAKDIPASIEADINGVELGQTIYAEQLQLPPGAKLITGARAAVLTIVRTRGMRRSEGADAEAESAAT